MKDTEVKWILENRPIECSKCKSPLFYKGSGKYACQSCGNVEYDDFGKVKAYLDEHGVSSMGIISAETGVSMEKLHVMLREGRVEIPDGSKYYIKCEKCGCSIRYGRYCPDCARRIAAELNQAFYIADMGEKPKMDGSMRFIHGKEGNQ